MKLPQLARLAGYIALAAAELSALIFLWNYLTPRGGLEYPPLVQVPLTMSWIECSTFILMLLAASFFLSRNKIRYFAMASLCAALILAVLWVRSSSSVAEIAVAQTESHPGKNVARTFKLESRLGKLSFSYENQIAGLFLTKPGLYFTAMRPTYPRYETYRGTQSQWYNFAGVRTYFLENGTGTDNDPYFYFSAVSVSYWLLLLLCLPFPAVYARQLYRKRLRQKRGHCIDCGYDLRATEAKCPECGTAIIAGRMTAAASKP